MFLRTGRHVYTGIQALGALLFLVGHRANRRASPTRTCLGSCILFARATSSIFAVRRPLHVWVCGCNGALIKVRNRR